MEERNYNNQRRQRMSLPFDEDENYFHPEEVHDAEEQAAPQEESIYTDDPVRVYLREMGSVPLLTRKGEVDLARKMERGKVRMQKAISRTPLVQAMVLEFCEQIKRGEEDIDEFTDITPQAEESQASLKKRQDAVRQLFMDILALHKRRKQITDKIASIPGTNRKLKKRWNAKLAG
jgi:RNA polymerase primary sigma factor